MPRPADLTPTYYPSRDRWVIDLAGQFTPDGKRRKEFFRTEREANERALEIKNSLDRKGKLPKGATPELIRTALHYDQLFQFYGLSGLAEGCKELERRLTQEMVSPTLTSLVSAYLEEYRKASTADDWKWLENKLSPGLWSRRVGTMDAQFWREELAAAKQRNDWAPRTYNLALMWLKSLYRHAHANGRVPRNPIEAIRPMELPVRQVAVFEPEQLRELLENCFRLGHPEMALHFAVLCFAGLRPEAEFIREGGVCWEDVLWSQGLLRVRDSKTAAKTGAVNRYVTLNATLRSWLEAFRFADNPVAELMEDSECRAFITGNPSPAAWNQLSPGKRSRLQKASGLEKKAPPKDIHAALNALRQQGDRIERKGRICPGTDQQIRDRRAKVSLRADGSAIVVWGGENLDITRHSFGSYLAAVSTADEVRAEMGHTTMKTFFRHYRNARTPEQAAAFWTLTKATFDFKDT